MQAERKAQITLRAPIDVVEWINKRAERNASSQSSEIVRLVRDQIDAEREQQQREEVTR